MRTSSVILVPVDFEEGSELALTQARELARDLGCDLWLLHVNRLVVSSHPEVAMAYAEGLQNDRLEAAKLSLEERAAKWGAKNTIVREGEPGNEILSVIEDVKPRFVVMGTHGRRGVSRLLLGSVAERVVRQSSAPVLVVSPKTAASDEEKKTAA